MLWTLATIEKYSAFEILTMMTYRQQIFVVDQHCVYLDTDDKDREAIHLVCWQDETKTKILAYSRLLAPGVRFKEASIGRISTAMSTRGKGLGKDLVARSIDEISKLWPDSNIRISGQEYLQEFYEDFGFVVSSKPYEEDGIPHLEMFLDCTSTA